MHRPKEYEIKKGIPCNLHKIPFEVKLVMPQIIFLQRFLFQNGCIKVKFPNKIIDEIIKKMKSFI